MKFLISGGGICGLTTAIALHQQGLEVVIYEAAKTIKAVGAGLNLSSNAIRALSSINLAKAVMAQSKAQKGGQFFTPSGKILNYTDFNPLVEKYGIPGLISIHRAELHTILLAEIKDKIPFYTNKRAQSVEQKKEEIILHFADGTSARGNYLLACDGIHSAIRKQLLPEIDPSYAGYTIWRGLVRDSSQEVELAMPFKTWGKNGQFGAVPMTNNRIYWFASFNAKQSDPALKKITLADLAKRFAQYHAPIPQLLALSKSEDLLMNEANELNPISQYAFGNVLLMGDAAHAMTPNLGQGACQAIEDAAVLAQLLKTENSTEQAFLAFEEQRIPRTKKATIDSRQVGKAAHIENRLLIALRNFYLQRTAKGAFKKQIDFLNAIEF